MFQNSVLKIFEVALKHGSEELILLILLKANLLSPLLVAYRDIFQNGVLMKNFHIDNFTLSLKKIVSYIQYVEEVLSEILFQSLTQERKEKIL